LLRFPGKNGNLTFEIYIIRHQNLQENKTFYELFKLDSGRLRKKGILKMAKYGKYFRKGTIKIKMEKNKQLY
jgi:hypothetical protein